jgi:predicted phosphodiesterase
MGIFRSFILLVFVALNFNASFAQSESKADSVIVVFGDTRTNHEVHRVVVKAIMHYKPVAVFHTGDLVYNGKRNSAWSLFKEISAPIIDSSRFYPSFGNHELHAAVMSTDFKLPNNGKWYSVDIGKIHFTVIDNYSDFSMGSEQYKWLVSDLSSYGNKFCVVVMHLPVYSSGPHQTRVKKLKNTLVPLFTKYGVDFVFSGHNHCYEKAFANNVYYITTAGGGAPLYPQTKNLPESQLYVKTYNFCTLTVNDSLLQLRALDTNLKVIDEITVKSSHNP